MVVGPVGYVDSTEKGFSKSEQQLESNWYLGKAKEKIMTANGTMSAFELLNVDNSDPRKVNERKRN